MEKDLKEMEKAYTPLMVIEEASRCLLCYDAPCSKACPAGTDPSRFIRAVRFRNLKGAAEVIRENNALGGICARICPTEKLCKKACSRCGIDRPIEIGKIQQFITDYEQSTGMQILKVEGNNKGNIAIVGSGPSGLEASAVLARLGYKVTVYESRSKLGGWLSYGIPEYRLHQEVIDNEVQKIKNIGVEFKINVKIGKDITMDELKAKYDAVLLATGMSYGRNLPVFEGKENVMIAVDFLAKAKNENFKIAEDKVAVVIGGGDVAMDVATTLKLQGVKNVVCTARETMEEFLASPKELENARKLNVSIIDGYTPINYDGKEIVLKHMKVDSELKIKADYVIVAIGQKSELDGLGVETVNNRLKVNGFNTSDSKIFATGDIVDGDKIAVYAVKLGHEAALKIHEFLGGKKNA